MSVCRHELWGGFNPPFNPLEQPPRAISVLDLRKQTNKNNKQNVLWLLMTYWWLIPCGNKHESKRLVHKHLDINKKAVLHVSQRWPRDARYISGSYESLRRYSHLKLSKMAACRQLGFDVSGNSAIRSADPEYLEPNMKCIGSSVAEYGHSRILGSYGTPILGEGEVVGGQRWHHSKERW